VPLGLEADGWNDYRARLELESIVREIAAGVWRPPERALDVSDRDPTFHEFASFWLEEKEADLERSTYDDYLNLLTKHLLPAFHDKRLSQIDYEAIRPTGRHDCAKAPGASARVKRAYRSTTAADGRCVRSDPGRSTPASGCSRRSWIVRRGQSSSRLRTTGRGIAI
jgi:hypothetical protein